MSKIIIKKDFALAKEVIDDHENGYFSKKNLLDHKFSFRVNNLCHYKMMILSSHSKILRP